MIDERIIELYRSQLAASNEEKGMLYAQVKSLTEEVSMLRQSVEQSKHDTSEQVKDLLSELKSLHEEVKAKDKRIAELEERLSDALAQIKLGNKKRFVRTSEQVKLLNNRDKDVRSEEKSDYDGSTNAPLHGEQEDEEDMDAKGRGYPLSHDTDTIPEEVSSQLCLVRRDTSR